MNAIEAAKLKPGDKLRVIPYSQNMGLYQIKSEEDYIVEYVKAYPTFPNLIGVKAKCVVSTFEAGVLFYDAVEYYELYKKVPEKEPEAPKVKLIACGYCKFEHEKTYNGFSSTECYNPKCQFYVGSGQKILVGKYYFDSHMETFVKINDIGSEKVNVDTYCKGYTMSSGVFLIPTARGILVEIDTLKDFKLSEKQDWIIK